MAHDLRSAWGENIRRYRQRLDFDGNQIGRRKDVRILTPARLGELLDPPVNQSTVSRWERGLMEPSLEHKHELARVLGVNAEKLFPMAAVA